MRQLFPTPVDDVDPVAIYATDDRPAAGGRPWLLVNMIASADGGVSVDGTSGALGGPSDKAVFVAIRGVADVILVAAGTVMAENYRAPQTPDHIQEQRRERGQSARPRIAIVTNSLSVPADHRVFDSDAKPMIITHESAPADRREELSEVAEIIDAGEDSVNLARALERLASGGAGVVLAEGGPTLNGALVTENLVDELCLSLSPTIIGGSSSRIVKGGDVGDDPRQLRLDRVLEGDGLTFHRFVRA